MSSEGPTYEQIWNTLSRIDCNEHTEKKGNLTYLSWAWAWGILMENFADASFKFADNESHSDGTMTVHCTVTIGDCERSMWLPVMNYKNSAIVSPNARDISDNKMRCLTKALALMGLGHYIYAGEDTANAGSTAQSTEAKKKQTPAAKQPAKNIVVIIDGKEWSLEDRIMAIEKKISDIDVNVDLDTIEELLEFIYVTIVMFSLPPEGTPAKEGDPDTAAGWIEQFTQRNRPTLLELYKRGFKDEIQKFHKRLDPLKTMSISEIRSLQKLFYKGDK